MRRAIVVLCLLAGCVSALRAQDRGFGLGIILGEPTGLSAKMWLSPRNAVDAGLAWSFHRNGFLHIHADYLWHFPGAINSTERLVLYAGLGGRLGTSREGVFGVRVPLGLAWWPRGVPLELVVEVVPGMDLLPATDFEMQGGLGLRWYF
jgi:hypothetical protein